MNDCPRQNPAYRPAPTSFIVIVWKKINFSAEDAEDAKDYWVSEFFYRNHFVITAHRWVVSFACCPDVFV